MKRLFLISLTAIALAACGGSQDAAENSSALDNLSIESLPANDASALEAVAAQEAQQTIESFNSEADETDNSTSNAASGEPENAD